MMPARLILLLLATFGCCAAFVFWAQRNQIATARRQAWQEFEAEERLLARLNIPIDADGRELTLAAIPAYLADHTGLAFELDSPRLAAEGIDPENEIVVLPEARLTAEALLSYVLDEVRLAFDARGGSIRITTPDHLDQRLSLVVYPIPQPQLTASMSEEDWIEVVVTASGRNNWNAVGGLGHVEPLPGGLAIVQTRDGHRQIRAFFQRLGAVDGPPESLDPVLLSAGPDTASERRIREALARPISVDVKEAPLSQFVSDLAHQHDLPMAICHRRLADAGVSSKTPVSVTLADVPLKSVLRHVLSELELTYAIDRGVLRITTYEEAEEKEIAVAYPVHDLVQRPEDGASDFDSLSELITTTLAPHSWGEYSGPPPLTEIASGWLVFGHTEEVHDEVASLLADLRRTRGTGSGIAGGDCAARQERIQAALQRELRFDYPGIRMADLCTDLSQQTGVNFKLHLRKLEEAGFSLKTPIFCSFPPAPLLVQLRRLCEAIDLAFCIRDDVVLITSPEDAEAELNTRVYDVRALIDPDFGLGDADLLVELITQHIAPTHWDNTGGPGALVAYNGLLVASHTDEVHRQLAGILNQLETHCLLQIEAPPAPAILHVPADQIEERLERRMRETLSVDWCGEPLEDALQQLAGWADAPLWIDSAALNHMGVDRRQPVTFAAREMTLGGILDEIVVPLGLSAGVNCQRLEITSGWRLDQRRCVRFFSLAELLAKTSARPDALQAQIEDGVAANAWTYGNGFTILRSGWLVVSGYSYVPERVEDWLHLQTTGQPSRRALERKSLIERENNRLTELARQRLELLIEGSATEAQP